MKENTFIVLVTVYNSVEWIGKCLDSVINQDYQNYKLVVIDDASTDGTWDIIQKYDNNHVYKHRNEIRVGDSTPNTVMALKKFSTDKEDIIVHVDGDDYLSDSSALSYLNEIYQDDVWLTYGQYMPLSKTYFNYCRPIPDTRTYRKSRTWLTSHLKTFKRWLWDLIDDNDLRDDDGNYIDAATDCAFMYPMIEMAGPNHIKFVKRVLYVYNDLNPLNYKDARAQDSLRMAAYIQNKKIYDEL